MTDTVMTKENLTEYFTFLDLLRESGKTNMFGAAPYVQDAFELKRAEAAKVTVAWMKTFGEGTPAERAAKAEEATKVA